MKVKQSEIIKILGISRQSVFNFEKDGILIKDKENLYDIPTNVQAYIKFKTESSDEKDATLIESKRRKENALASIQELNLAERENKLIDRDTVINDITKILTAFKSKLLNLSGRLSADILNINSRPLAQNILENSFKELLTELSELETYTDNKFTNTTKKTKQ